MPRDVTLVWFRQAADRLDHELAHVVSVLSRCARVLGIERGRENVPEMRCVVIARLERHSMKAEQVPDTVLGYHRAHVLTDLGLSREEATPVALLAKTQAVQRCRNVTSTPWIRIGLPCPGWTLETLEDRHVRHFLVLVLELAGNANATQATANAHTVMVLRGDVRQVDGVVH